MNWVTKNLKQDATYWAEAVPDGFGGSTFSAPTALKVRWENKTELFADAAGNELKSNAVVYLPSDVTEGGYLYLGSSTAADPTAISGAREIRKFEKYPTLSNRFYERVALL